ncbi:glutathione peroxidase [Neiella marina]|uniref:Glutathione peroxidase n=1 Tax=Neiella holothuriorum TaxID=2870530 RepID=A0ABS7EIS5_9GAMM|nr:glutathione peroxidase [Neiella holothuriorum]MBW8192244.1 glutathione peroxidase [Neiella holothuriorum]
MTDFYAIEAISNKGDTISMGQYKGQVLLIVNTASACGFTPQYQGLQALYETYEAQGFKVLAFPCNQFGKQEAGDDAEIRQFCDLNFNISFPLFQKIEVNGAGAHPLYQFLTDAKRGLLGSKAVKWNFTKFLVDRNGNVMQRYAPTTKPEELVPEIEALL